MTAAAEEAPPRAARRWLAAAAVLSSLLLALDLVAAMPAGPLAASARLALEPTCHQRPERSLAVSGRPLGACARCVGLHASGVLALAALGLGARLGDARPRLGAAAIACAAVLGADVLAGMSSAAWDVPWLRALTGIAAGSTLLAWGAACIAAEEPVAARAVPA